MVVVVDVVSVKASDVTMSIARTAMKRIAAAHVHAL